jgi:hypothetical protein
MRIRFLIAVLLLPILVRSQDVAIMSASVSSNPTSTSINHYLNLFASAEGMTEGKHDEFLEFLRKLESKRSSFRHDQAFLHYVFTKTHQKFLKTFTPYATFSELFQGGNYNCLSGTALYALLLDHFKIDYTIVETNYHIFLLANTSTGKVLLEATDPVNGFNEKPAEIESRISEYKQNVVQETEAHKKYHHYSFNLYNEVRLDQLLGLMHYNLSILNYNKKQFQSAISHLDKALELYNSPRIEEFSRVILLSVVESPLDDSTKEIYVRKIQSLRKKRVTMVATAKAN